MIKVMFVCTGNICRSPMAEAVFQNLVREAGMEDKFEIQSSGTGSWHVGERPHFGTQEVLKKNQVRLDPGKRAQHFKSHHLNEFDYILVMDTPNMNHFRNSDGKVKRLLDFAPAGSPKDVPDPYYEDNFDYVFDLVTTGSKGLLAYIRKQENI